MRLDATSPACNPGVLDTMTWDEPRAARLGGQAIRDGRFAQLAAAAATGYPDSARALDRLVRGASRPPLTLVPASACAHPRYGLFLIGVLADGQRVFVVVTGAAGAPPRGFGKPLATVGHDVAGRCGTVCLYPVDLLRRIGRASASGAGWAFWMCR
jgi:hypothetical protein